MKFRTEESNDDILCSITNTHGFESIFIIPLDNHRWTFYYEVEQDD